MVVRERKEKSVDSFSFRNLPKVNEKVKNFCRESSFRQYQVCKRYEIKDRSSDKFSQYTTTDTAISPSC